MLRTITLIALIASVMAVPKLFNTESCTLWDISKGTVETSKSTPVTIKDSSFSIAVCNSMRLPYTIDTPAVGDIKFTQGISTQMACQDPKKTLEAIFTQLILGSIKYTEIADSKGNNIVYLINNKGENVLAVAKVGVTPTLPPASTSQLRIQSSSLQPDPALASAPKLSSSPSQSQSNGQRTAGNSTNQPTNQTTSGNSTNQPLNQTTSGNSTAKPTNQTALGNSTNQTTNQTNSSKGGQPITRNTSLSTPFPQGQYLSYMFNHVHHKFLTNVDEALFSLNMCGTQIKVPYTTGDRRKITLTVSQGDLQKCATSPMGKKFLMTYGQVTTFQVRRNKQVLLMNARGETLIRMPPTFSSLSKKVTK